MRPPSLPFRFLEWFCPAELFEGIAGDLVEQFDEDVALHGPRTARRKFVWNVLKFFRPSILARNKFNRPLINNAMFKSYFIIALRNIAKQKTASFINLLGISIALTFFMLAALFIQFDFSFDKFHEKYTSLYRVEHAVRRNGVLDAESISAYLQTPFLPEAMATVPGITAGTRYVYREQPFVHGTTKFVEPVYFADPDFLEMFSLDFTAGNPATALNDVSSLVVSESIAGKIFGHTDVVGKDVEVNGKPATITAVFRDLPENSSLTCTALMKFENFPDYAENKDNWNFFNTAVFIELPATTDFRSLGVLLDTLSSKKIGKGAAAFVQPFRELHFDLKNSVERVSNPLYSYILGGLALIILLTACINYTLLALAMQAKRSVEVGIRKVSGASESSIRWQFFGEMQLIIALAIPVSIGAAIALLPVINQIISKHLSLTQWSDPALVGSALGVIFLTGLVAALYPALVLAKASPQRVLKINSSVKYKASLGNYLVVFQFACCLTLMIMSLVMYQQMEYVQSKDLGFKGDQILSINTANDSNIGGKIIASRFRTGLAGRPEIKFISGMSNRFGNFPMSMTDRDSTGKEHRMEFAMVDYDFFEMLDAKLVDGRFFSRDFHDDSSQVYIVNETMARQIGSKNVLGHSISGEKYDKANGRQNVVVGVVKDFNFQSLDKPMAAMIFGITPRNLRQMLVKVDKDRIPEAIALLKKTWTEASGDAEMKYSFLDDDIAHQYDQYSQWLKIISWSSGLGIFIACLGMFGLTGLLIVNRTKEIGIRRVLGASVPDILTLLSKRYLWLILVSFCLAVPVAYYYAERWLSNFAYHIGVRYDVFVIPVLVVTGVMVVIIVMQSLSTIRKNPTESLRYE